MSNSYKLEGDAVTEITLAGKPYTVVSNAIDVDGASWTVAKTDAGVTLTNVASETIEISAPAPAEAVGGRRRRRGKKMSKKMMKRGGRRSRRSKGTAKAAKMLKSMSKSLRMMSKM